METLIDIFHSILIIIMISYNFGECYYNKVKNEFNITDELIIAKLPSYKNNNRPTRIFGLYDPIKGKKLDFENICKKDTLIVEENLINLIDENSNNYENSIDLLNQNINIFNLNDNFYSYLCYYFISPIKKGIPLKGRFSEFYQNITLCDS